MQSVDDVVLRDPRNRFQRMDKYRLIFWRLQLLWQSSVPAGLLCRTLTAASSVIIDVGECAPTRLVTVSPHARREACL
jgi:hypothetical protein